MEELPICSCHTVMVSGWAHAGNTLEPLYSRIPNLSNVTFTSPRDLYRNVQDASSQNGGNTPTHSAYAEALIDRIRCLSEPVVLLGWSTGAMIALEAAVHFPTQVKALILLSGTASFSYSKACPWGVSPRTIDAMAKHLKRNPESVLDDFFRRAASPETVSSAEIDRKIDAALEEGTESLRYSLTYLRETNLNRILPHVRQPSLLIHGKQDAIVSAAAATHLNKHMPRAAKITLAEIGHTLPEQCADTTAIYIEQFLSNLP